MAISLIKGQRISLDKESGGSLNKVVMGLGWDPIKKKGFFSSKSASIDLDASCCLFDENNIQVDIVYFGHLKSNDGSIIHTGDNLTGAGEGDDERIIVNLGNIPANIKNLVFTVNSFRGHTFNDVENAYCRLVDDRNQKEVARYTLTGGGNHTGLIMTKLYRNQNEWKMQAIGEMVDGKTVHSLIPAITPFL
ncbi:MAG: TerD family protein [Deltaproteobacteria bacterium]|jgi:tellurium resistance protein TerZ|nr:TerD family protein [Deltaproteobacteria bacterium]